MQDRGWQRSNLQVFWGEIAPCDQLVQIYQDKRVFIETLEGFAGAGLSSGDSVIINATEQHLHMLEARLRKQGFDISALSLTGRYTGTEVIKALSAFMVNNWPDEALFTSLFTGLLINAKQSNDRVRAFAEMVAVLWQQRFNGATVHLESL